MSGYTEYRPHGENLMFEREFSDDTSSSEVFFAETVRALGCLSAVVRPTAADLWLSCFEDDIWVGRCSSAAHPIRR